MKAAAEWVEEEGVGEVSGVEVKAAGASAEVEKVAAVLEVVGTEEAEREEEGQEAEGWVVAGTAVVEKAVVVRVVVGWVVAASEAEE